MCIDQLVSEDVATKRVNISRLQVIGTPPPAEVEIELKGIIRTGNTSQYYAETTSLEVISGRRILANVKEPPTTQQSVPIQPVFSVAISGFTPTVRATTNLPDDMELMVSIAPLAPGCRPYCGYRWITAVVKSGVIIADGPFFDQAHPSPTGQYTLEISSPLSAFQPQKVRAVIGNHGENLTGPNIVPELAPGVGPTVHYSESYTIP